jgi:3-oxoacyl-[acyl-carrier protein] reductase
MSLEGKIALITGGSRNIGRAIALKLAENGADVGINFKSQKKKADEVVEIIQKMGRKSQAFQADVSVFPEVEKMAKDFLSEFGRIDILVNNVGPFIMKKLSELLPEEWEGMIQGNLNSTFYCCKAFLSPMQKQKSGVIINIGGPNAEKTSGFVYTTPWSIAKTGVVILSKSIAKQEGKNGIRVNVVNPGYIQTEEYTDEMKKNMPKDVPLGFLGKPEDIAEAVVFLASDKAKYINGAVLNVHGGLWV